MTGISLPFTGDRPTVVSIRCHCGHHACQLDQNAGGVVEFVAISATFEICSASLSFFFWTADASRFTSREASAWLPSSKLMNAARSTDSCARACVSTADSPNL